MSIANTFALASDSSIQHVNTTLVASTSTSDWTHNFISSSVKAGDFIFVQVSSPYVGAPIIRNTGYTLLDAPLSNTTYDSQSRYYYRIADGTETSVDFSAAGTSYGAISFVSVFRGVDNTNPFDVPHTTDTSFYYLDLSYRPVPDIYPVSDGALIIKSMHTPFVTDPTSVLFRAPVSPHVQELSTYSYATPNIDSTAIIATTTKNEALKSVGAIPNFSESNSVSYGSTSIAVALRPA